MNSTAYVFFNFLTLSPKNVQKQGAQDGNAHTGYLQRTWDCVKTPFQAIVTQDPAPTDNFLFGFEFVPLSPHFPQQCCGQKSTHFHPLCSKFNFVWGGRGGVASFSNITGKVLTLLTSIVGHWTCTRSYRLFLLSSHFLYLEKILE